MCSGSEVLLAWEEIESRLATIIVSETVCLNPAYVLQSGTLCPDMEVCSVGGAASTCCPCLEKQLTVLEGPDSVGDLSSLIFQGCTSIGQCSLDSYLKLFDQCGYGARANALLSAVGAPFPPPASSLPPRLAAPPPPAVIPPVPQSIPSGLDTGASTPRPPSPLPPLNSPPRPRSPPLFGLDSDRAALLAQKSAIMRPSLWDWTTSGNPCDFEFVSCNLTKEDGLRVTGLNLAWYDVQGTLVSELGSLAYLSDLNLNDNNLTGTIPSELGSLYRLAILFLNNNRLSGTLPNQLGSLTRLQTLDLSRNQLSGIIPDMSSADSLLFMYLQENRLVGAIPSKLGSVLHFVWAV
eukprot:jgi/Mesvir1/5558/Mv15584-RA.1